MAEEYELKQVKVRLKLAEADPIYSTEQITTPDKAAEVMAQVLSQMDREYCCVVNLDGANHPINFNVVSIGDVNQAHVPIQNVFKSAILSNAASIMMFHNHPSGSVKASREDIDVTKRLIEAGKIMNIPVLDHIIVGGGTKERFSFREESPEMFNVSESMSYVVREPRERLPIEGDSFAIYQLKDDDSLRYIRFEGLERLQAEGNKVDRDNYNLVYCEFGENPTLFNTAKASAAKYKISGMSEELMNEINSMVDNKGHAAVSDRCRAIRENGCGLDYVGYEIAARAKCEAFKENLDLINPNLPTVIQRILWNHFMEKQTEIDIATVMQRIIIENPCGITLPETKYPYMMKMFLYSAYCGMTASTIWDGKSTVKGGYITIKNTGEVVANYALESEAFKNFLYTHCYLDFPSTDQGHGAYGEVYKENDDYYFKLNFQIRIK